MAGQADLGAIADATGVFIASGIGGNSARAMARGKVPLGGSMWTFAVMPD